MTVLGDLAQATGPASPHRWDETLAHLGRPANARARRAHDGLPVAGRVPRRSRTGCCRSPRRTSRRRSRCARPATRPTCTRSRADELVDAVAEHALALAKEFATVAVIADDGRVSTSCAPRSKRARRRARRAGRGLARPPGGRGPGRARQGPRVRRGHRRRAGGDRRRTNPHGVRLLFVALTRAVQHLAIAHSRASARRCSSTCTRAKPHAGVGWSVMADLRDRQQERQRRGSWPSPVPSSRSRAAASSPSPTASVARRPRAARSSHVRCAPDTDVIVGTMSGSVHVRGDRSARRGSPARAAASSIEDATRGRRAHRVRPRQRRRVRGRVPRRRHERERARRQVRLGVRGRGVAAPSRSARPTPPT